MKSILNFRDVSQFVNEHTGTRYFKLTVDSLALLTICSRLRTGLLYRSARPGMSSMCGIRDHAKTKKIMHPSKIGKDL
jgi:hypothetical protein